MIWEKYSNEFKFLLDLRGSPIAITYSMLPVKGDKKVDFGFVMPYFKQEMVQL